MHPQYTAQIESIVMKLCPKRLLFQSETWLVYITANIAELVSINGKLVRKQRGSEATEKFHGAQR
jgi:hypothetical protein